jgi:hypothetical protein
MEIYATKTEMVGVSGNHNPAIVRIVIDIRRLRLAPFLHNLRSMNKEFNYPGSCFAFRRLHLFR